MMAEKTYKYHKVIDEYLDSIKNDTKHEKFCKEQHMMRKWLIPILDSAYIDTKEVDNHLELSKNYVPFELMPWEKFLKAIVFGVKTNDEYKDPIFSEFLIMMGRGGGKNGFISDLALDLISNKNGVKNYDVHLIANTENQAKTSFEEVKGWAESNKVLNKAISSNWEKLLFKSTQSKIIYRTSNPGSGDGGRPGAVIFDEIHQYTSWDLIKVHTGGLGKGGKFGRRFYITTDGYVRNSVLDELKDRAMEILRDGKDHNMLFPFILKLDDISEVKDKSKWKKANHMIVHSRTAFNNLEKDYKDSLDNPSLMEDFLTKKMNIPYLSPYRTVASVEEVKATGRTIDIPEGSVCIGGVDMASLKDFTSVGLLFRVGDNCVWKQHTFIHEKSLETTEFNFPIKKAVKDGLVTIVRSSEYPITPAHLIRDYFVEQSKKYQIKRIVGDAYRISPLKDSFSEKGMTIEEVRSGTWTDSKLYPEIAQLFAEKRLVFQDDYMMRWYVNNTTINTDKKGNKTFQKIDPIKRKNDGFMAFVHAFNYWYELPKKVNFDWGVF